MLYSDQLRDRRWQKRRLEILERDTWQCQRDGCKHKNDDRVYLVVHHKVYRRGLMAWEYEDSDLITLCQKCHDLEHQKTGLPLPELKEGEFFAGGELKYTLGFTPSGYLTNAKGKIVCGCFRMDLNSDAPEIVLPGTTEKHWAENATKLASQPEPIPVFTKEAGLPWQFQGWFRGEGMTRSGTEIQIHRDRNPQRAEDISMVLFLEKVSSPNPADEQALQRLWRKGKEAWRDVPSATEWVDELRGNKSKESHANAGGSPEVVCSGYFYGQDAAADFRAVCASFGGTRLQSPYRSTVPLLSLVHEGRSHWLALLKSWGAPPDVKVHFEFDVASAKPGANPSQTDAMVFSPGQAWAIEAKWTEPRDRQTVSHRLNRLESDGGDPRVTVTWWLDLLKPFAKTPLRLEDFHDLGYQFLHRAASACSAAARQGSSTASLIYLHFTPSPLRSTAPTSYYVEHLRLLHRLLGGPEHFSMQVVDLPLTPTAAFQRIASLDKHSRTTAEAVKAALCGNALFGFGTPQVTTIGAGD